MPKTSEFFSEAGHRSGRADPSEGADWGLSMTMTAAAMALRRYNIGGFGVGDGVSVLVAAAMVIWGGGS